MGRADVGDHRHIRFRANAEAVNLPQAAHAHLQHQSGMAAVAAQHRAGNANVVVFVANAALDGAQWGEASFDQLAGCGFTG